MLVAALVLGLHLGQVPELVRTAAISCWVIAALAVVIDVWPYATPGLRSSAAVLPSIGFSFALLLSSGLPVAILVQAIAVIGYAWRTGAAPWRTAFNVAQFTLALTAAHALLHLSPGNPFAPGGTIGRHDVVVVALAVLAWFAVSHLLVSVAVRLRFGGSFWRVATRTAGYEGLSTCALLLVGPVLVVAARASVWLLPLILIPLYAVYRTARMSREQEQLALLDPLTGLANRKALIAEVGARAGARRELEPESKLALLLLDLDRFKNVNDALGHGFGDRLLVEVGRRLSRCVRLDDLVARLGGDEFAILAGGLDDVSDARALAERVKAALVEPVHLDGMPLDVAASIGIAICPEQGEDFASLMRHADVAMYEAKTRGDAVAVYSPENDPNSAAQLSLVGDLRRSLERPGFGQLSMHYQPQVAIPSGEVVGVEALLRWRHPTRGPVSPDELIRVVEHSAVMRLLTFRVIDEVIAQLERWGHSGLEVRASVNVSVRDLHTTEIVKHIADGLARHDVASRQLQLEITEGALMADPRRVLTTLQELAELGVALSLDDFGTGYSSMLHLRRLPLSEVKIDRSFVFGMVTDDDDASIVRSIIELAAALGLRVVAEGVEDEQTWRRLAALGCHVAQGWFHSRPMPADELPQWLDRQGPPPQLLRSVPPSTAAAG